MTKLSLWWVSAVTVTILAALVYGSAQQNYRQSANDPQIQMAENTAAMLATGQNPNLLVPTTTVDIATSLDPWVMLYDKNGELFGTNARLEGAQPKVPAGVLTYAQAHHENRVTWQPKSGVRSAIVAVAYASQEANGYVVAGRSLREVENRERRLSQLVLTGWAASLLATLLIFIPWPLTKKR